MVVIYIADIPEMTRAKGEIQFGHAVVGCISQLDQNSSIVKDYVRDDQLKLAMEVDSVEELKIIQQKAWIRGVATCLITDAARTCFSEPTITCLGLGPMSKSDSNALTRKARMRV